MTAIPAQRGPGRPPLPTERIIDTAIRIVDEEGAAALTFRTLAARLSSGTATLYRHVANRTELLNLVFDGMIGEAALDGDDLMALPWDGACRLSAGKLYAVLSRHGGIAALLADVVPTGRHALTARERLLAVLHAAGFDPLVAVRTVATLGHYVLGFAMQTSAATAEPETVGLTGIDPELFPQTASHSHLMPRPILEEFEFGLDLLIQGLHSHLPRPEVSPALTD